MASSNITVATRIGWAFVIAPMLLFNFTCALNLRWNDGTAAFASFVAQLVLVCLALPVDIALVVGIERTDRRLLLVWLGYHAFYTVETVAVTIYAVAATGNLRHLYGFAFVCAYLPAMLLACIDYKDIKKAAVVASSQREIIAE